MEPGRSNSVTVVHTNPGYPQEADQKDWPITGSDSVHVIYNAFSSEVESGVRCNEDDEDARSDNDSGIDDSHEIKANRTNVRRLGSSRTRKEAHIIAGNNIDTGNETTSDNVIKENDGYAVSIYISDSNLVKSDANARDDKDDVASDDRGVNNSRSGDCTKHVINRVRAVCDIKKEDSDKEDAPSTREYFPIRNSVIFDSEDDEESEAAETEADEDEGFVRFNFDDYPETVFTELPEAEIERDETGEEERRRRRKSSQCILHPADIYQPHAFSAVFTHNIYTNIKSMS
jgi:hypothetical protein